MAILFGVMVGFALGLTGSGGGIFAVPLLVYGLQVAPREAIGVSQAAVGATALLGMLPRLWQRTVELPTGAIMALSGMVGAPVGSQLAKHIPEDLLLLLFSGVMLVIAVQMWQKSMKTPVSNRADTQNTAAAGGIWCARNADGQLAVTFSCVALLGTLGIGTGLLSGMFGVGGGFVIIPALVLISGMGIHHAVGTSLMVISLISFSALSGYLWGGGKLSLQLTLLFILGGFVGMQVGSRLSRNLSGPTLQRVFAVAILLVAAFVIFKSTWSTSTSHRPASTAQSSLGTATAAIGIRALTAGATSRFRIQSKGAELCY